MNSRTQDQLEALDGRNETIRNLRAANAELIAALRKAESRLDPMLTPLDLQNEIRAALAKASN